MRRFVAAMAVFVLSSAAPGCGGGKDVARPTSLQQGVWALDQKPESLNGPWVLEMEAAIAGLQAEYDKHMENVLAAEDQETDFAAIENTHGAPPYLISVGFDRRGCVRSLGAWDASWPSGVELSVDPAQQAHAFLMKWTALFQNDELQLEPVGQSLAGGALASVGFRQTHLGLPVWHSHVVVHVGESEGIRGFNGLLVPTWALPETAPAVGESEAQAALLTSIDDASSDVIHVELGVFDPVIMWDQPGLAALAYKVDFSDGSGHGWIGYVDAVTSDVIEVRDTRVSAEEKEIYSCENTMSLPGTFVCSDPSCDCSLDYLGTSEDVCELTHKVYDYYDVRFDRDGWDDDPESPNHRMLASSDYGAPGFMNGYWDSQLLQVYFGDAAVCTDLVGHEWTHGVDAADDGSGADVETPMLNEGFADVFGQFFEFYENGLTDWRATTGSPQCDTIVRYLDDPPLKTHPVWGPYPDHWSNFESQDGTGHYNSTIVGKGAYLLGRDPLEGSETHWGRAVTGIGVVDAEQIFYDLLIWRLSANANITEFGQELYYSARSIFGWASNQATQAKATKESLGIFSYDYSAGKSTDRAVQYEFFQVNGQDRWWLVHKYGTSTRLHLTYRTCNLYQRCSWSSATTLGFTSESPGAAVYSGELWIFFVDASTGALKYRTVDGTGGISSTVSLGWTSDSGVSATSCGGFLYIFWKEPGAWEKEIRYARYHPSVGWSPMWTVPSGTASDFSPTVVCEAGSNAWIAYRKLDSSTERVFVRKMDATLSWHSEVMIPGSVLSDTPSIDYYRSRLHVSATQPSANAAYYASCELPCTTGSNWTRWVKQDGSSDAYVTLDSQGAGDGRLYLWHRAAGSTALYWRNKNSE